MPAINCTVARTNPLHWFESNFKDARPVRLASSYLVVGHYDRISVIEDVRRLSLDGIVGTVPVICVAVQELEAYSPVPVADHEGDGVWWLFTRVHHAEPDFRGDVHCTRHFKALWKIGILHQVDVKYPLVVAGVRRDAELLLVRFGHVDVAFEFRVLLNPVGGHKPVIERRRLYDRVRHLSIGSEFVRKAEGR